MLELEILIWRFNIDPFIHLFCLVQGQLDSNGDIPPFCLLLLQFYQQICYILFALCLKIFNKLS